MSPPQTMPPPPSSAINNHHVHPHVAEPPANPMVGTRVAGILLKWINCGKRWRPRWFVLQDGVLSYYKIHSPIATKEPDKECRIIGTSSHNHNPCHVNPHHRKPLGELHLKVLSYFIHCNCMHDCVDLIIYSFFCRKIQLLVVMYKN